MQSAVWPLSEQQISAGDLIPVEVGQAGVRLEHKPNVMQGEGKDRPKQKKRAEIINCMCPKLPLTSVRF